MAFLDKLMFWKKKGPDLGVEGLAGAGAGPDLGLDVHAPNLGIPKEGEAGIPGAPGLGEPGLGAEPPGDFGFAKPAEIGKEEIPPEVRNAPSFGTGAPAAAQPMHAAEPTVKEHDVRIIYSKLDAIRAMLDAIDQRIKNIEKIEETKEKERTRW